MLAGCLWRVLPSDATRNVAVSSGPRYLSNEALLAMPLPQAGEGTPTGGAFVHRAQNRTVNKFQKHVLLESFRD